VARPSVALSAPLHAAVFVLLNQVERWFALIINQAICRSSFDSATDLKRKINGFVEHYNQRPRPFMRAATAESNLTKIERLHKIMSETRHYLRRHVNIVSA
jgi:hypothetical protein